ncbi:MAG: FlgD immunoglobulin-like domain containing protein [Candidatus Eisenbacteria bacterium]
MRRSPYLYLLLLLVAGLAFLPTQLLSRQQASTDFVHFETSHVHPLALTPDGTRLLAVNTPDGSLTVFDLTGPVPMRVGFVPVGLEPVSVCARSNTEAWVVNQLSDAVSIVDLNTMHVRATLHVGDEPADVVFAGTPERAFVSVSGDDAVMVYDPANLSAAPSRVAIPGRQPRALARSADGQQVFVAVLSSGNRTTILSESEAGDSLPPPQPSMSPSLPPAPRTGLIAKQDGQGNWRDESGHLWNSKIRYSLSEVDVARIDANTRVINRTVTDLAATNLGLAVDPVSGAFATSGTEARNAVRFEPNLRGHVVDTRLSLVPTSGPATLVNLDPHINYAVTPGPASEADSAIGMPTGVDWAPDGQSLYVTSMATARLAVVQASGILRARVPVVEGPSGVLADPARPRVYVLGRFRGELQTLDAGSLKSAAVTSLGFDPTPDEVVNGRRWFYGGRTSGHGDQSCASCHLFGDMDQVAWDLGDPRGTFGAKPPGQVDPLLVGFHPMKGPMVTQTLRSMRPGLLHWRGDRNDLNAFQPAFVSLLGRNAVLADSEFVAFSAFASALRFPPNPNRFLDNTLRDAPPGQPSAVRGATFFTDTPVDGTLRCAQCHLPADGGSNVLISGVALRAAQDMKVPHLRNLYTKRGFRDTTGVVSKRGFGFAHDGAFDNLVTFLRLPVFTFAGSATAADNSRRDLEAFLLSFNTGMAPAVGAVVTLDSTNRSLSAVLARLDTLVLQSTAGNCDLIAKGRMAGSARGWRHIGSGQWQSDLASEAAWSTAQLTALAGTGAELTVMGVPVGSGLRFGVDRDRDGFLDADELLARSDPANPASTPGNVAVGPEIALASGLRGARPNPFSHSTELEFTLVRASEVELVVFDVLGREVRVLARGVRQSAGVQRMTWDGRRGDGGVAGAGVYFVRLGADGGHWTRAVVKVRG